MFILIRIKGHVRAAGHRQAQPVCVRDGGGLFAQNLLRVFDQRAKLISAKENEQAGRLGVAYLEVVPAVKSAGVFSSADQRRGGQADLTRGRQGSGGVGLFDSPARFSK